MGIIKLVTTYECEFPRIHHVSGIDGYEFRDHLH